MTEDPLARDVVAIVPARDRADTVGATVLALRSLPDIDAVVVVDDGSRDDTTSVAHEAGAHVLRLPANRGKGGAVAAGVEAWPDARVYLLIDADVGASAAEAATLLERVLDGRADMAIAVLPAADGRGGFGVVRRLAGVGIRRATGSVSEAPLSGQRAVRGALLRELALAERFGLETGLTIDARRAGARVFEVPVAIDHRHTGRGPSGFAHRARQGVDVVRALWPRLTSARQRIALIAATLLVALVAAGWSGARWAPTTHAGARHVGKIIVVTLPPVAWSELGTGRLPNLDQLARRGAIGAMTVRGLSASPTRQEQDVTLGAGARADVDERDPSSFDAARRASARAHAASLPGALGDALHAAGLRTAVIGDGGSAAIAALADRHGAVDVVMPLAPVTTGALADDRLARADVTVVGLDDPSTATVADGLLGRVVALAPRDALLVVLSFVRDGDPWRLTPAVVAGGGVERGYLSSSSTRRLGLVTLTDVAPTVLDALGQPVPGPMVGHPFRLHPDARPDPARLARLDRDDRAAVDLYTPLRNGFVAFLAFVYAVGLVALVFARGRRRDGSTAAAMAGAARLLALIAVAFPLATFVARAAPESLRAGGAAAATIVVVDLAIVALASRARRHPWAPLAWVFGASATLLLVDVCTGARLQLASPLGYSPAGAARFYGIGNAGFAVLASAAVLAGVIHLAAASRRREALVGLAALLAFVVVADGAPSLGADAGGLVTLAPIAVLLVLALAGTRLSWRRLALAVAIAAAAVVAAAAVDLARAPESRTHLGRFASDLLNGRGSSSSETVLRKLATNVRVVRGSMWTWTLPLTAAFAGAASLLQRGQGAGQRARHGRRGRRAPVPSDVRLGLLATVAIAVVGFAANDSGVLVAALASAAIGPTWLWLALTEEPPTPVFLAAPPSAPAAVPRSGASAPVGAP